LPTKLVPPEVRRDDELHPCYGNGYILEPALMAVHADGNTSTELEYVSHEVVAVGGDVTLTRIKLQDRFYPFVVTLCFKAYRDEDVIEQWTELMHNEEKPVTLVRFASSAPWFQASRYWMSQFHGDVIREGELTEEQLTPGVKVLDSKLGARADRMRNPSFLLALDGPAREESGEVYGGTLAWSGSFQFAFDLDWRNRLRVVCGINPLGEEYRLAPGKTFATPTMLWTWSDAGKGQVSRNFHRWARHHRIRDPEKPRPALFNNWETTYFDFDEKKLVGLIEKTKELGLDVFLLDDGWFSDKSPKNNERIGLGDWEANPKILPHGLSYLADESKKHGLIFGIWMEPEGIHVSSKLYQAHPDWAIMQAHRPVGENQMLLDLTRPAARDYMWSAIDRTLQSSGAGYLKWDANRFMLQPGSAYLPPDEQQHLTIEYQWGLYDVMRRLAEKYPQVTAMLCSGGGGRVDYEALKYFHTYWPSDNTDPVQRVYIQWGYSHFFPGEISSNHITAMGHRPAKFAVDVALTGALGVDCDVGKMTAEERRTIAAGIKLYKDRIRAFVQHADLYRLESPYEGRRAVMSYVLPDQTQALVFIYQLGESAFGPIKPRGLDPAKKYRVREINLPEGQRSRLGLQNKVVDGATLMAAGFASPLARAIESAVIEIVAEP